MQNLNTQAGRKWVIKKGENFGEINKLLRYNIKVNNFDFLFTKIGQF